MEEPSPGADALSSSDQDKVLIFPDPSSRGKKIPLSLLINRLNHHNFQEQPVIVGLRHRVHGHHISLPAIPQPCQNEFLECHWVEREADDQRLKNYELIDVVLTDGRTSIHLQPKLLHIDGRQVSFRLPDESFEAASRAHRRHRCEGVLVRVSASGVVFPGELLDFNGTTLRVRLRAEAPLSFDWVSRTVPVGMSIIRGDEMLYMGECTIVRQGVGHLTRDFVLKPTRMKIQRFKPKEFRPDRRELVPNPTLVFKHPLIGRTVTLRVVEISGTGCAVMESTTDCVLMPGLMLPEVWLHFSGRIRLPFRAQVIHRLDRGGAILSGIAILDIDIQDHLDLVAMLYSARDPDTLVGGRVDLDDLWDFFFETGFIYPSKYAQLAENKEKFKETYVKLYEESPTIARHFIHMDLGKIQGHFAMLRLYEKTWVNHHHAALHSSHKAGLIVMGRMTEFINDVYALRANNFSYSAGYYRSDNKFPVRFFGGFAEKMRDPQVCSIDTFDFLFYEVNCPPRDWGVDGQWQLARTTASDLVELNGYYNKASGGLTLAATDMLPESLEGSSLSLEYARSGFRRELHRLSVRKDGVLKAVVAVNVAETGLNLSELSNVVHFYLIDMAGFRRSDFELLMTLICVKYGLMRVPIMVFGDGTLQKIGMQSEKKYHLMIVNISCWDDYMRYTQEFLKKAKIFK
jgi:hypothetical protein